MYFTSDFYQFFRDLAGNNNRDWFQDQKKRYESSVKKPFEAFVGDLIAEVQKENPKIQIEPKQAIFRIYRDIRFSKDKTPYKLHMAAAISEGGRKDPSKPGLYIQMGGEDVRYYSGLYMLNKDALLKVRTYIANKGNEFKRIYSEPNFTETFGEIRGEKNKILPKDFKEYAEKEPLLYNKSYYFYHTMPAEEVVNKNFMKKILDVHQTSKAMRAYLHAAIN